MKSFLLAKFGTKHHIRALYEKGHVYFNHYSFFKQTASNILGQHDSAEFATDYFNEGLIRLNSPKQNLDFTRSTDNGLHRAVITFTPPLLYPFSLFYKNRNYGKSGPPFGI